MGAGVLAARVDTAKTESCLSKAVLWQAGHAGVRPLVTKVSNWREHSRHTYSKIGMLAL